MEKSENESEKRETLADIVAEMRRGTKLPGYWRSCDLNKILKYHADRIEAAAKREKAEIEANALSVGGVVEAARHTPGNAAAMRKALVELTDKVLDYLHRGLIQLPLPLEDATAKARAALAAPPRQCDVGTPEEQEKRYKLKREVYHTLTLTNALAWAQTPYEAQEGGAE